MILLADHTSFSGQDPGSETTIKKNHISVKKNNVIDNVILMNKVMMIVMMKMMMILETLCFRNRKT